MTWKGIQRPVCPGSTWPLARSGKVSARLLVWPTARNISKNGLRRRFSVFWEMGRWRRAMNFASHYELDNLVIIVDMNRLAQSEPTMFQHKTEQMAKRCDAFGFNTLDIDGHDVDAVSAALLTARDTRKGKPHAIIAKTFKGKGFPAIEDKHGFHGKPLAGAATEVLATIEAEVVNKALLAADAPLIPVNPAPEEAKFPGSGALAGPAPGYKLGEVVATRNAFGTGLRGIGGDERIVSIDADV